MPDFLKELNNTDRITLGVGVAGFVLGLASIVVNIFAARANRVIADVSKEAIGLAREAKEDARRAGQSQIQKNVASRSAEIMIHESIYRLLDKESYEKEYPYISEVRPWVYGVGAIYFDLINEGEYGAYDVRVYSGEKGEVSAEMIDIIDKIDPGDKKVAKLRIDQEYDHRIKGEDPWSTEVVVSYRDGMSRHKRGFLVGLTGRYGGDKATSFEVNSFSYSLIEVSEELT